MEAARMKRRLLLFLAVLVLALLVLLQWGLQTRTISPIWRYASFPISVTMILLGYRWKQGT
jgi:E3 ubiquitin-protein ligase DOA10